MFSEKDKKSIELFRKAYPETSTLTDKQVLQIVYDIKAEKKYVDKYIKDKTII